MKKNTLGGFIFDFDGTLVNSEEVYHKSDNEFARRHGFVWDEVFAQAGLSVHGLGDVQIIQILQEHGLHGDIETLRQEKLDLFLSYIETIAVYDEVLQLAHYAVEHGLHCGIVSGSAQMVLDRLVDHVGIRHLFNPIFSCEHVPNGKPAPDGFLYAAQLWNIPADQCLVFEDSLNGVCAAQKANMSVVGISNAKFIPNPQETIMHSVHYHRTIDTFCASDCIAWIEGSFEITTDY